jgi:alpha-L-fucosidase
MIFMLSASAHSLSFANAEMYRLPFFTMISIRNKFSALALGFSICAFSSAWAQQMPKPAPIPDVPALQPPDTVAMQDPASFAEVKMDFPIAGGPFEPTWDSINKNYPAGPSWLRDAKFGIWIHFGPQAAGQSGDWYARKMYQQGTTAYANHLHDFGPPSEVGYKDILHTWNPAQLNPAKLVQIYKDAGARFLIVQGVHHDNFDNWDSAYQPWNSVNMGPKRDLIGEWSKASHAAGIRFGVAFHHEYTWWWYQPAFGSDSTGPKAGVPYDANQTLADGKGKWWEGYDPRLLYGINLRAYKDIANVQYRPEKGIFNEHLDYAHWYTTRWALRIMDVINKYDPDFIYTDGDSTQPFSGEKTGTGYKCDAMQRVIADYYNHTLATHGKVDTISIIKFHSGTNGVVNTVESHFPKSIKTDQEWIGENALGDWFYKPDLTYSARSLVLYMLEVVSRDGNYAVNIPLRPDGSLDDGCIHLLHEVGAWMKVNGEGIYGSKAWVKFGEGTTGADGKLRTVPSGALGEKQTNFLFGPTDFRFTSGKDGSVYAFALSVPQPKAQVKISSLGSNAGLLTVHSVTLLGSQEKLVWKQEPDGLKIICPSRMPSQIAVTFKIR